MYEERFYRGKISSKFKQEVSYKESDILICSDKEIPCDIIKNILVKYYEQIADYVKKNPMFLSSLSPIGEGQDAPDIVREMIILSGLTGIGPFSAVAGAIAKYVGNELLEFSKEIILENGGDIFLKINENKRLGVYMGEKFETNSVYLKLKKRESAFGIASSSAVIGHSLNFGKADLVSILAKDSIAADGFATALSNKIKNIDDISLVLKEAKSIPLIEGILICFEGKIFLWGDIEIDG